MPNYFTVLHGVKRPINTNDWATAWSALNECEFAGAVYTTPDTFTLHFQHVGQSVDEVYIYDADQKHIADLNRLSLCNGDRKARLEKIVDGDLPSSGWLVRLYGDNPYRPTDYRVVEGDDDDGELLWTAIQNILGGAAC